MKVNPIASNSFVSQNKVGTKVPAFKSYSPSNTYLISKQIEKFGIEPRLKFNDFIAECVLKTTKLFKELFGQSSLPSKVSYKGFYNDAFGSYDNLADEVSINSQYDKTIFDNLSKLAKHARSCSGGFSSSHSSHVFVHEYSHAAHWHHLENRNGYSNASRVWCGLVGTGVPTAIGRLITRFKLSDYAVDSKDMCEFMAERMSKDICNGITSEGWCTNRYIDVKYDTIFNRKWKNRFSCPQAYIDYFTQQVWNGDIDEAEKAGQMAEAYLAELDGQKIHSNSISKSIFDFLTQRNRLKIND